MGDFEVSCDIIKGGGSATEETKDPLQTSPSTPVRRKLSGPGVQSAKGFGGTTFMIDPSKFKKPTPSSPAKNCQVTPLKSSLILRWLNWLVLPGPFLGVGTWRNSYGNLKTGPSTRPGPQIEDR